MKHKFQTIFRFLSSDLWTLSVKQFSRKKRFLITQLRIFALAFRGFKEDNCPLQASALTFYSLLSIVPVFAMLFSIAKGFGFETLLENHLLEAFPAQKDVIHQVVDFAHLYIQNTKGGAIAFIGIAVLIFTIIKVLSHIEKSFNSIWNIHKNRSIVRKFSDYLSIFLISPILIILSSSITVFISSHVADLTQTNAIFSLIGPFVLIMLKIFPYLLIWFLFGIVYMVMPNTNVQFKAAFFGAIIAGTLFQILQWGFITFQFGVTKYNAIYGSFSILPLFLIWLQISWMIVLLGSEIAFATQNSERYEFEKETKHISYYYYKFIAIGVIRFVLHSFTKEEPVPTAENIADKLHLPIRLVHKITEHLLQANLVHLVIKEGDEKGFQPAMEPNKYTIAYVLQKMERAGTTLPMILQNKELKRISTQVQQIEKLLADSKENKNLLQL